MQRRAHSSTLALQARVAACLRCWQINHECSARVLQEDVPPPRTFLYSVGLNYRKVGAGLFAAAAAIVPVPACVVTRTPQVCLRRRSPEDRSPAVIYLEESCVHVGQHVLPSPPIFLSRATLTLDEASHRRSESVVSM
ncbi:hypothetical protein MRX96_024288 [Rhipicephalus microplus]